MNGVVAFILACYSATTLVCGVFVAIDAWKSQGAVATNMGLRGWRKVARRFKPSFSWCYAGFLIAGDAFIYGILSVETWVHPDPDGADIGVVILLLPGVVSIFGTMYFWARDIRVQRKFDA